MTRVEVVGGKGRIRNVGSMKEKIMEVSEFDYELPKELIAQDPIPDRSASRLMILDKKTGETQT